MKVILDFGSHSHATVELERLGCETKIKIIPENKDGTILTISSEDEDKFVRELEQLMMRYFI